MKYLVVSIIDHMDLLKVYSQYNTEYTKNINMLHAHTKLVEKAPIMEETIEREIFKGILDYMSLYSIKHSIGIEILKRASIEFTDVADVVFYATNENFVVVYN